MSASHTGPTGGALPSRQEIDARYRWRVEDIFPDEAAWEQAFGQVVALLGEADRHRGRATESAEALLACLRWLEELGKAISRVYTYAMLRHDEDTSNPHHQALHDRASSLRVQVMQATAFVRPELLAAPEERIRGFLAASEELAVYEHFVDDILRRRPHVLSPELEDVLAQGGEVAEVPYRVFSMLNDADLNFPAIVDEDGSQVEVTKGRYLQLLQRRDRRVRRDAYEAVMQAYGKVRNTMAAALDGAVKVNLFHARVRRYPNALAAALDDEAIDPQVYDNLVRTVRANLAPLHRYHALRRRLLGLDRLQPYDLYVPIVPEVELKYTYEQAWDLVREALAPLGPEYAEILDRARGEGWIDVYENRGKRGGAYSMGWAYGTHPYILMNWQDNLDSVMTLAHELGHAVHSHLSQKHQPYIYAGHAIFVAEVASTLNEGLLVHHLLQRLEDRAERAFVLNKYLDDFRGTVYGQVMFAQFEQWIHEQAQAGQPLTAERLSAQYRELSAAYWGADVEVDELAGLNWARIPHFYYNFYVYKYATGLAAATALVGRILEEGAPAVERYLDFLKRGASDYPLELLRLAGVDLTTPAPIEAAIRRFDAVLSEFAAVVDAAG